MKPLFSISRYPAFAVFVLAGVSLVAVGYSTYNLLDLSMANLHFLREHGWKAVQLGAVWQLLEITAYAALALLFYLIFKVCESELVRRYNRWQDRR